MAKKKQLPGKDNPRPTSEKGAVPKPALTPATGPIRPNTGRAGENPQRTPLRPITKTESTPSVAHLPIESRPVVWWPPVVLALLGVLLYVNTFGHQYALDDIAAISQNLFVKKGIAGIPDLLRSEFWHFSNISLGYYRPLSLITFALEQEYFKDNPNISHMINAGLYGLTGLVIGILLQKWLSGQTIAAFLIGLVFIAHPIHTEIVANIKGRDEILSFLFISLMLLAYWRYLETKDWGWIFSACLALYLAFLSKESSIVSLALIPAMQYWFARRPLGETLLSLWPFLFITAVFFFQKKQMIGTLSGTPPVDWANYPYAIEKTQKSTMFKFLLYYIRLIIYPHPLVYDYSYNVIPSGGKGDWMTWAGFVTFIGLLWLAWKGFIKRTLWGFGIVWFFVTMAPGLGFIWIRGGIFAERFAYAAVMGFGFVLIWALQKFLVRDSAEPKSESDVRVEPRALLTRYAPVLGLMAVVAGLYSFKTVERNRDWENNFVLFNSALPYAPNSCQVQRHVANEWIEKGLKDRAKADSIANATNALKPKPSPDKIKTAQALIDTNIARANKHGRWALDHLQESTRIYPSFGEAYFSMAYVFQKITPNVDSAKYYYKQTMRAANAYAPAYNNLGVIYQNEGITQNNRQKLELASYYYNRSMVVNPAYVDGLNNRNNLLKATGIDVKVLPDSIINKY
ncbi:tetratricopeptide repeat protein [Spirosoma sp. KNUC1025]|uniref:tetratricopeptide repeat protein n=1 Tax=Spirosoma sp. KNUC1025 TaxID=2894082 RepID=UPI003864FA77|nr:glycosyltransferase family 39 protein [Spirosoma sp. KNUC1025]